MTAKSALLGLRGARGGDGDTRALTPPAVQHRNNRHSWMYGGRTNPARPHWRETSAGVLRSARTSVNIYFMSESRAVLLAAAAEVFARHGFKGTRIQEIVQVAGVNERMIYHHFGSKDGLYRAVIEDQRAQLGMAWQPVVDK